MAMKYTVEAVGPRIEQFLGMVVQRAGLALTFRVRPGASPYPELEKADVMVDFDGTDTELLLANKAELLLALEHLTVEVLGLAHDEHALLHFDAHEYRLNRLEELRLSALAAADRVKSSQLPFHFGPMNSRERRLLHLALSQDPAVRSESAGVGPTRAVVVYPAGMKSLPASPTLPPRPRRR